MLAKHLPHADDPGVVSEQHGVHAVAGLRFHEDVTDVGIDCCHGDEFVTGYLLVAEPQSDEPQDVAFAWGEQLQNCGGAAVGRRCHGGGGEA